MYFLYTIIITIILSLCSAEIVQEIGSLKEFIGGQCENCEYDNFLNHTSEGIASENYNIYMQDTLDIQTQGFGNYRIIPENSETMIHWRNILNHFIINDFDTVNQLLSDSSETFHYDLVEFEDTLYNRTFFMLRERLNMSYYDSNMVNIQYDDIQGSFDNGWGLYIINPSTTNKHVIIQAPHPNDDYIAPYISTNLFLETDAFAYLLAGAGREVKWTNQGDYTNDKSLSDPSRNTNTVFHEFHKILCDSLINIGPHSPIVFHMHSFDENESHSNFNSIVLSGGYDAQYVNKPIRDVSSSNFDIINFTEEYPINENYFSDLSLHPPLIIDQYYQAHYDSMFYFYGENSTYEIPHSYELNGPINAVQMHYLRNYFDNRSMYEPWIQVELDEFPQLFKNMDIDVQSFYNYDYPISYNTFSHFINYYTPFINSVVLYLENWNTYIDTIPPIDINTMASTFDGFHYVDLMWEPTDDTNFKNYRIYVDVDSIDNNSEYFDHTIISDLIDVRTKNITIPNLNADEDYFFSIVSEDHFGNISNFSNLATDNILGHEDNYIIQDFDFDISLSSFPNHDEDPDSWNLDTLNTYYNSPKSLKLYGNTWKVEDIENINISENDVWQIASFSEVTGEIIGLALQDSVNTLFYSFYGTQELDIEEWITVYQGAFPENKWNVFQLPIADDWFAYFDYYPEIDKVVYINDKDANNIESVSYFDDLVDISPSIPFAPEVSISYEIITNRRVFNSRSISIQFLNTIIDNDSENFEFLWYFGDGNESNIANPIHTYNIEDDHLYNVILKVTDQNGYIGYATIPVELEFGNSTLPLSINFIGDVMIGRNYDSNSGIINQYGVNYIFEHTLSELGDNADITVANLECPLTTSTDAHPTKSVVFKARPENVSGLVYAGIDIVSLANNHTIDYGLSGLIETQNILEQNNILFSGAGENSYESYQPLIYNSHGLNLAFLASSDRTGQYNNYQPYLNSGFNKPGFAYMTPYYLLEQIESVQDEADFIIIEMHAGSEYSTSPGENYDSIILDDIETYNYLIPNEEISSMDIIDISDEDENYSPFIDVPHMWDREIRHFAIDNGADLVIVHHPHVIQGFEVYNGKVIAHSLGNFVFDLSYPETFPSVILNADINTEDIYNFNVKPVYIDDNIPYIANGELGLHILDYLAYKSKELNSYLNVDRDSINGYIILDENDINPTFITSKKEIDTFTQDNMTYSIPTPIHKFGNFHSIDSLNQNIEYRVGRELIWFGNMEDEGCTLWNLNSQDEFYDSDHPLDGERSICLRRNSESGDNIVTNLQHRIKINDELNYGLYGNIKTENSNDAKIQIRYYSNRTGSISLGTDSFSEGLDNNNNWTTLYNDIEPRNNTNFFDLRLYSDIPDTGVSKSWFDDVSVIEWSDWYNIDNTDSLLIPNDYYFVQIRTNNSNINNNIIYKEVNYNNLPTVNPYFTINQNDYQNPSEINFYNQSSGYVGWFLWDFGDGTTSIEENPIHTYTDNGPFTVSLSILDYNNNIIEYEIQDLITFNNNIVYGDLNFDSNLNILDIVIMINLILGETTDPSGILSEIGDLDNNNSLDILDVVMLINMVLDY